MAWATMLFNNRDATYVPQFSSAPYMVDCDVQLSLRLQDNGNTHKGSIEAYRQATVLSDHPVDAFAVDIYSSRTKTLAFLAALDVVPITSGSSTSDELDRVDQYPYFTRVIPPDSAVAFAVINYYKTLGFTRIGVTYINDPYGVAFEAAAAEAGASLNVEIFSAPHEGAQQTVDSVKASLEKIKKDSGDTVNAFLGVVLEEVDLNYVAEAGAELNMIGGGSSTVWTFTDGAEPLFFERSPHVEELKGSFLAQAAAGSKSAAGDTMFDKFVADYAALDSHAEFRAHLNGVAQTLNLTTDGGGDFPAGLDTTDYWSFDREFFANSDNYRMGFWFDCAIQIGMGACKALHEGKDPANDGSALHAGMSSVQFDGWSGGVVFDETTGSRVIDSVSYEFKGVQAVVGDSGLVVAKAGQWSSVSGFDFDCNDCTGPFLFGDGTSSAPQQKVARETDGEGGGVPIIAAVAAMALLVSVAAYFFVRGKNQEKRFSDERSVMRETVEELQDSLKQIKAYSDNEKKLIQDQIVSFKAEYAQTNNNKDIAKLLIDPNELVMAEVLGKGSFGEVFKGTYRGSACAVKTMLAPDDDVLTRFREEILLLADLRHPNVVGLVGACWGVDLMALVMEFCERGESSHVLKSMGKDLSWGDPLLKWACDVAKAVKYLHMTKFFDIKSGESVNGIMHRDLKPDNCLVTEGWSVKVADFGEARGVLDDAKTLTQVGTPLYIAPEIIKVSVVL
jgi:hypothetical protein